MKSSSASLGMGFLTSGSLRGKHVRRFGRGSSGAEQLGFLVIRSIFRAGNRSFTFLRALLIQRGAGGRIDDPQHQGIEIS